MMEINDECPTSSIQKGLGWARNLKMLYVQIIMVEHSKGNLRDRSYNFKLK